MAIPPRQSANGWNKPERFNANEAFTTQLSPGAHERVLRVAGTVADLDQSANISAKHLAEAAQFPNLIEIIGIAVDRYPQPSKTARIAPCSGIRQSPNI